MPGRGMRPPYVAKTRDECRTNQYNRTGTAWKPDPPRGGKQSHYSGKILTPRQRDVYLFIKYYYDEYGYAPTNKEIAHGLGFSSKENARRIVHILVGMNLLVKEPYKWRKVTRPVKRHAVERDTYESRKRDV